MSFFYVISILFLILFSVQLTLRLKLYFNVKNNSGKLQVKFMFIKIFDYKISVVHKNLKLVNKKGKIKYVPIVINEQSIEDYSNFEGILFRKIYFKSIAIYFNFGIKNGAFSTAMTCGAVDIFSKIGYSILKTKKSEVKLKLKIYPSFKCNVIKFGFKAKISMSVLDFFWSFMEASTTRKIKSLQKQ